MKNKVQRLIWVSSIFTFGLIGYLFSQTSTGNPGKGTLEARLQANSDGTVTVFFRGTPNESYQIRVASGSPENSNAWAVAASNIVAGKDWTAWVDTNVPAVGTWFYQVVPQVANSLAPPAPSRALTIVLPNVAPSPSISEVANRARADLMASNQWLRIQEAADSGRLIGAVNAGDYKTALAILKQYGIADSTLKAMAGRLGQPAARAVLSNAFVKASISVRLWGDDHDVQARIGTLSALGYGQMIWIARSASLDRPGWEKRYDTELAKCPASPIGALEEGLREVNAIEFFRWYDRYAERLHSVTLNWSHLANYSDYNNDAHLEPDLAGGQTWLKAMFQLVKARKPDAFVWVNVVRTSDDSDLQLLGGLSFKPDGLMVRNLATFDSQFSETRDRYLSVVGSETPMVVAGFFGYASFGYESEVMRMWAGLYDSGGANNARNQQTLTSLKAKGKIIAPALIEEEQNLKNLGYRGIAADWSMLQAVSLAGQ